MVRREKNVVIARRIEYFRRSLYRQCWSNRESVENLICFIEFGNMLATGGPTEVGVSEGVECGCCITEA